MLGDQVAVTALRNEIEVMVAALYTLSHMIAAVAHAQLVIRNLIISILIKLKITRKILVKSDGEFSAVTVESSMRNP